MAIDRNSLPEGIITDLAAATSTYLTDMSTSNIKYGTSSANNIQAVLSLNRKFIAVGLEESTPYMDTESPFTIGGHQIISQDVYIAVFVLGADTEADQKKAVDLAEEVETNIYENRTPATGWSLNKWVGTRPDEWSEPPNLVRTFFMIFTYIKFGSEGTS